MTRATVAFVTLIALITFFPTADAATVTLFDGGDVSNVFIGTGDTLVFDVAASSGYSSGAGANSWRQNKSSWDTIGGTLNATGANNTKRTGTAFDLTPFTTENAFGFDLASYTSGDIGVIEIYGATIAASTSDTDSILGYGTDSAQPSSSVADANGWDLIFTMDDLPGTTVGTYLVPLLPGIDLANYNIGVIKIYGRPKSDDTESNLFASLDNFGFATIQLVTVPEPKSYVLLFIGLFGMVAALRRRLS